jgi:16S rRNA C967 or C1407 C5-methylase (RsmB/RsmF family)/NOL1/NOP2/fmu family ribosome biogenesis protein
MKKLLGSEFPDFLESLEQAPAKGLHVNLQKITTEKLKKAQELGLQPISYTPEGFTYTAEHIGNHPLHHAGAFYVQEPSAMMPLSLLEGIPLPDQLAILDVCASPGGKSSQAANLLVGRSGFLISNEISVSRYHTLYQNIERLGIRNVLVTNTTAKELGKSLRQACNLVIVDAPCSGEGMFRKNPIALSEWSEENVQMCAARQKEILQEVAQTVSGGGYLLYSTCTFSVEENEQNVIWFLENFPDFELCDPPLSVKKQTVDGIGVGMSRCRRFYPHIANGEGQFAALLKRKGQGRETLEVGNCEKCRLPASEQLVIRRFLTEMLGDSAERLSISLSPSGFIQVTEPNLPSISLSPSFSGVKLGLLQKGRLIPDHRFFMAYGSDFIKKVELSREEAEKYIHGETFPSHAFDGFGAATYWGCTMGGLKISAGVAKNHYPKGLRTLK